MENTYLIEFKDFSNQEGHLTPIENCRDIPFEIKRIYYITKVKPGIRRGFHSHRKLCQVLIAVHGSVKILVKNPFEEQIINLASPIQGLFIGPMVWREMYDFSEGSVLLVLASEYYDESDYIRDYECYTRESNEFYLEI